MNNETARSCFDASMPEPLKWPVTSGQVVYFSDRAPNKETPNEDALAIIEVNKDLLVLAVADGLGGLPAGETASRTIIEYLIKALTNNDDSNVSSREIILDSIERANQAILETKSNSATTLVVAEIQGNVLRTYHAGDSMIMLMGNRGKMKYSAIPHSPTGYALMSGMIDESAAMLDEDRHYISNYIGSSEMRVEIGPTMKMASRDTLLLASDGLSDNLFDHEIISTVRKGEPGKAGHDLVKVCRKFMQQEAPDRNCHPDDMSFILYRLNK